MQILLAIIDNYGNWFNFIKRDHSYTLLLRKTLNWVIEPSLMGSSATERNIVVEKTLKISFIKDIISFDISLDISFAPYLEHLLAKSEVQSKAVRCQNSYTQHETKFFSFCLIWYHFLQEISMLLIKGILKHWKGEQMKYCVRQFQWAEIQDTQKMNLQTELDWFP